MTWVELAYSKSQVKRAGKTLRDSVLYPPTIDEQTVRQAELILENWRSAHEFALNSVQMTLRRQVERTGSTADVAQRLKERRTIIDKLLREPTMQLSTMQDIAGCRAVLPDIDGVRRAIEAWHDAPLRQLEIIEDYDYLDTARPSGYRAFHLIVRHSQHGRVVEVQLRSQPACLGRRGRSGWTYPRPVAQDGTRIVGTACAVQTHLRVPRGDRTRTRHRSIATLRG